MFGSIGYYMLIFLSGIERIPADLYEAATIDGANKVQQFTDYSASVKERDQDQYHLLECEYNFFFLVESDVLAGKYRKLDYCSGCLPV